MAYWLKIVLLMVQMISSLSFKQENTISDEPVVDLLKFLNKKLDTAIAKARLPSGRNPLQQLVLIIADGRLHERVTFIFSRCLQAVIAACLVQFSVFYFYFISLLKLSSVQERLKRCVRDALAKNRMIAFLLLDNPENSIMDLMVPILFSLL